MLRIATALAAAVLLAACTQYSLVERGRVEIGETYSVESQIAWSKRSAGKRQIWTVDGPALQALWFYTGIKEGEPLLADRRGEDVPVFRANMKANDVAQLVADSLSRGGAAYVETSGLRPAAFGSRPGYRFEITYLTKSGLRMRGFALGAVIDGKLYLVLYYGAGIHYFDEYRDEVERIFESIEGV